MSVRSGKSILYLAVGHFIGLPADGGVGGIGRSVDTRNFRSGVNNDRFGQGGEFLVVEHSGMSSSAYRSEAIVIIGIWR